MGITFEMFRSDEEIFRKDFFSYSSKRCDSSVVFVRDVDLNDVRFLCPYFIMHNESFAMFNGTARQEADGTYSISFEEWMVFESLEEPHISYCRTVDLDYEDVLIAHLSISSEIVTDEDDREEARKLKFVLLKYMKRYFSKSGRQKYKVYRVNKNK